LKPDELDEQSLEDSGENPEPPCFYYLVATLATFPAARAALRALRRG
jgi:hypothetical protein